MFTDAHTRDSILVNPDHVRTAREVAGHRRVRLVMGRADNGEHVAVEVEGDLVSVWEELTKASKPSHPPSHAPVYTPYAPSRSPRMPERKS
jgi:hypothetical protein